YDPSGIRDTVGPFRIGQSPPWDSYFQGQIDEASVWSTARSLDTLRADMFRKLAGTEQGLAAYWRFEDGTPTVQDLTGHGNTGYLGRITTTRPVWTSDPALSFDGVDDSVQIADNPALHLTNAFTIEAWVNPAANLASNTRVIFGKS